MLQNQYQRKLTVIVSADVAGYARLTELNEIDVHSLLQKRLKLVREYISNYHGQVLRIHGDGCLCSFDSSVNALKACLEIQQNSSLLNSNEPTNNQIWFRMGVHLSEVIIDDSEPYGNGVNIAVRLQQKAEPGEILISEKTIQSLDDTHGFLFSKLKKLTLKNISNSISVCKLLGNSLSMEKLSVGTFSQAKSPRLLFAMAMICLLASNIAMMVRYWSDAGALQNHVIIEDKDLQEKRLDFFTIADSVSDYDFPKADEITEPQVIDRENNQRLTSVIKTVEALSDDFRHLRNEISADDNKVNRQIAAAANILSRQEQLLEKLLSEKQQDNFVLSSMRDNHSPMSFANYGFQQSEFDTPDYVIESLDSLDELSSDSDQMAIAVKQDHFGCLSCVSNRHINLGNKDKEQEGILNKTAVLVGGIRGDGARTMKNKAEVIEDYLYTKLQNSIQQSRLGAHIDEFTRLSNHDDQKIDDEYLNSLCNETKAVLVASYELMTNRWAAEGTYLRFHHCKSHKSMVLLEKNLAPTIMNVQEPYLTEDALQNVDKSVDYMIDKLVLNQAEYL